MAVASGRPQIRSSVNVPLEAIREIEPGYALMSTQGWFLNNELINKPLEKKPCSFGLGVYFRRVQFGYLSNNDWVAHSEASVKGSEERFGAYGFSGKIPIRLGTAFLWADGGIT